MQDKYEANIETKANKETKENKNYYKTSMKKMSHAMIQIRPLHSHIT